MALLTQSSFVQSIPSFTKSEYLYRSDFLRRKSVKVEINALGGRETVHCELRKKPLFDRFDDSTKVIAINMLSEQEEESVFFLSVISFEKILLKLDIPPPKPQSPESYYQLVADFLVQLFFSPLISKDLVFSGFRFISSDELVTSAAESRAFDITFGDTYTGSMAYKGPFCTLFIEPQLIIEELVNIKFTPTLDIGESLVPLGQFVSVSEECYVPVNIKNPKVRLNAPDSEPELPILAQKGSPLPIKSLHRCLLCAAKLFLPQSVYFENGFSPIYGMLVRVREKMYVKIEGNKPES